MFNIRGKVQPSGQVGAFLARLNRDNNRPLDNRECRQIDNITKEYKQEILRDKQADNPPRDRPVDNNQKPRQPNPIPLDRNEPMQRVSRGEERIEAPEYLQLASNLYPHQTMCPADRDYSLSLSRVNAHSSV